MRRSPGRRAALIVGAIAIAALLLPLAARAVSTRWHDDSLWANSAASVGGVQKPYDLEVFLHAARRVRAGESPYVDPDTVRGSATAPYAYPPLLALVLVPATFLPDRVHGSSPAAVGFSLLLAACVVGTLLLLGVRDWRCYPVALLYPPTLENFEYGAIGPLLCLFVALAWFCRDRVGRSSAALGVAVALKVFVWPLLVWLAATRRVLTAIAAAAIATALVFLSWAVIGFAGLTAYPDLLRRLSDLEASNSYSALAVLDAVGIPQGASRVLVTLAGVALLAAAYRAGRQPTTDGRERDRRSFTLALAAALVLTPILWLHYLVLLVVPIALARPRLSGLWFVPLAMTVFEALDWYRGWPSGEGRSLASVAAVVALVFGLALRRGAGPSEGARRALARA